MVTDTDEVYVTKTDDGYEIGNKYMSRAFKVVDDMTVTTKQITNKRPEQQLVIIPQEGSENFIIRLYAEYQELKSKEIDNSDWTIEASSYQNKEDGNGVPEKLLDGDKNTYWITSNSTGTTQFPHHFIIDMKKDTTFVSFTYTPIQTGMQASGNVSSYQLYAG